MSHPALLKQNDLALRFAILDPIDAERLNLTALRKNERSMTEPKDMPVPGDAAETA